MYSHTATNRMKHFQFTLFRWSKESKFVCLWQSNKSKKNNTGIKNCENVEPLNLISVISIWNTILISISQLSICVDGRRKHIEIQIRWINCCAGHNRIEVKKNIFKIDIFRNAY